MTSTGLASSIAKGLRRGSRLLRLYVASIASLLTVTSLCIARQPSSIQLTQLAEDGNTISPGEAFARVVRARPSQPNGPSVELPIWRETKDPFPESMAAPMSMIASLQEAPFLPVLFLRSTAEPPQFVVWEWDQWPSSSYLSFNWERLGLSREGKLLLMRWGLPWDGAPKPRPVCLWLTERKSPHGFTDFLLVDAPQSDRAIGCLAAGLLRHIGSPIWAEVERLAAGGLNAEIADRVRKLYRCAIRSQFDYVSRNTPPMPGSDSEGYLAMLGNRVRQDCLSSS